MGQLCAEVVYMASFANSMSHTIALAIGRTPASGLCCPGALDCSWVSTHAAHIAVTFLKEGSAICASSICLTHSQYVIDSGSLVFAHQLNADLYVVCLVHISY